MVIDTPFFSFCFPSEIIHEKDLGPTELPAWMQLNLPYANKRITCFRNAVLTRQSFGGPLFHADLVQLDTDRPFDFHTALNAAASSFFSC